MNEIPKKKRSVQKKTVAPEVATVAPVESSKPAGNRKVGDVLRLAREKQDKTLEGVSSVINIRIVQLKALESGDLSSLPGMIYAVGFLKSYANYLGLDGDELVRQFKLEHTEAEEKPDLNFPVPVAQSHLPDPIVLVGAGVGAVLLLIVWAFVASSGDDEGKAVIAEVQAVEQAAPVVVAQIDDIVPETPEIPVAETIVQAPLPLVAPVPDVALSVAVPSVTAEIAPQIEAEAPPVVVEEDDTPSSAPSVVPRVLHKPQDLLTSAREFGAGKSTSHVTIEALKPSWIQIMDGSENILFKKVLQAGEKYNVPGTPGLILTTSNAGGLKVYVDGKAVQAVGNEGEIVRGISLDPRDLSRQRIRVRR